MQLRRRMELFFLDFVFYYLLVTTMLRFYFCSQFMVFFLLSFTELQSLAEVALGSMFLYSFWIFLLFIFHVCFIFICFALYWCLLVPGWFFFRMEQTAFGISCTGLGRLDSENTEAQHWGIDRRLFLLESATCDGKKKCFPTPRRGLILHAGVLFKGMLLHYLFTDWILTQLLLLF